MNGILLAAGRSERMGEAKALLEIRGETFVVRGIRILREGGCDRVVVVANPQTEEAIRRAAPDAEVVANPRPEDGMISSIRLAAARLGEGTSAVVSLVDTPEIEPWWIRRLAASAREGDEILIPRFADGDGHPVLLTPAGLARLEEDLPRGLKSLIERSGARARRVPFGGPRALDCDTPEAYVDLRVRHARQAVSAPPPNPLFAVLAPTGILLLASLALGLLKGRPLIASGESAILHLLWIAGLAGAIRGAWDDLPGARDILPLAAMLTLWGAVRLRPYPGISAYLMEALFTGFLLASYQFGLATGRVLRNPPGRALAATGPSLDRIRLAVWWISLLPSLFAALEALGSLDAASDGPVSKVFAVPPFLAAGGAGLFLASTYLFRPARLAR